MAHFRFACLSVDKKHKKTLFYFSVIHSDYVIVNFRILSVVLAVTNGEKAHNGLMVKMIFSKCRKHRHGSGIAIHKGSRDCGNIFAAQFLFQT